MNTQRHTGLLFGAPAVLALLSASISVANAATLLQNNVPLTGQAASSTALQYSLNVPAGASNLNIAISGGTGDADMYVKFGATPTTSSYDCRPYLSGNNESCPVAAPKTGTYYVMVKPYSAFTGVTVLAAYTEPSGGGTNQPPSAKIQGAPLSGTAGQPISLSSAGSADPDGSITSYLWTFGDGTSSTLANPSHSYASAGTYTVNLKVTDNQGASGNAISTATITAGGTGGGNFSVNGHYYDKGAFDYLYSDYETAFSDNYTDTDVEIHSYIVVNFSANVSSATLNSSAITVKRLDMTDNAENNYNKINGSFELISPNKAIFKPNVEYYANAGGTFDWNNPNWNGIKPNYRYSVTLANTIKDTNGNALSTTGASWTFKTIDVDYGLYWFKDGTRAMKYVPGRTMPAEYYNPSKPNLIFSDGWAKTSVNFQSGKLRDYRRVPMTFLPGSMYPSQGLVDLVQIWKDSSKNYEHKAWNVGVLQWNQFADDDYANLSKPQMAEAKIWSTNGKGGMRYAIRKWTGSSWSTSNTNITTHAPIKPASVILADALMASTQAQTNPELRLAGLSLGNQVVTAVTYILKKEYAEGRISAAMFPKRLVLLDPYWRNGKLENSWTTNHPAYVDLGASSDWPAQMTRKILSNVIDFADNDPSVSFVVEYLDTSRTPDNTVFGQDFGDKNQAQRDMAAISYLKASWISGDEGNTTYMAHRHVNAPYFYFWQYAFAPPSVGFSASSSDAVIRSNMNYYKSSKIRYSITSGGGTPTPSDDAYTQYSGSWQQ